MAIKVEVDFDREKLRECMLKVIREETRLPLTGTDPEQIAQDVARLMSGR